MQGLVEPQLFGADGAGPVVEFDLSPKAADVVLQLAAGFSKGVVDGEGEILARPRGAVRAEIPACGVEETVIVVGMVVGQGGEVLAQEGGGSMRTVSTRRRMIGMAGSLLFVIASAQGAIVTWFFSDQTRPGFEMNGLVRFDTTAVIPVDVRSPGDLGERLWYPGAALELEYRYCLGTLTRGELLHGDPNLSQILRRVEPWTRLLTCQRP